MASSQRTVDYLLEQAQGAGAVSARKMFGEYAVYCGGVVVGLLCDDTLYLKDTAAGRQCLGRAVEGAPYPGARPHLVVGAPYWEDPESFARLIRSTVRALPAARAAKPGPVAKPAVAGKTGKPAPRAKAAARVTRTKVRPPR